MHELPRWLLKIAYRGEDFEGWQSQRSGVSVQDAIEAALEKICGCPVRIHGAGRTDSGVHALGQCAHFDAPANCRLGAEQWVRALNGNLPAAVRILACRDVPRNFHARFSARGKTYRYRIWNAPVFLPLEISRAWHIPHPLDRTLLREALSSFQGTHDFSGFCGRVPPGMNSTVRTIHAIRLQDDSPLLSIVIEGNGFLYRMVRCIVGACVRVAANRLTLEELRAALRNPNPKFPRHTAPAEGLYLVCVHYEEPAFFAGADFDEGEDFPELRRV